MKKSLFYIPFILCLLILSPSSANTESNLRWQVLLDQANQAILDKDYSYAIYKLRKAWLAVPDENLNSDPYKKIRSSLSDAIAISPLASEEKVLRGSKYSMDQLDHRIRNRESNGKDDHSFSVELRSNGDLAFTRIGLDKPYSGEGVCMTYLNGLSKEEMAKWKAGTAERERNNKDWYERHRAALKAKMPILITPELPKYKELLALCQPIEPGESKEITNFDFNPFAPVDVQTLSDL